MRTWLLCGNGHFFHLRDGKTVSGDRMVYVVCPKCETVDVEKMPQPVLDAIRNKFESMELPDKVNEVMSSLQYDSLNRCFGFTFAGMYHGVEPDGYIHT